MTADRNESDRSDTVRVRITARDAEGAEIAAAEAFEAGALGVVEEPGVPASDPSGPPAGASGQGDAERSEVTIVAYLPDERLAALREAIEAASAACPLVLGLAEPVVEEAWSETWKQVLVPVEISSRLGVTPPFATPPARRGQRWIEIDPGQAFGTGAHHSTRLALEGLDDVLAQHDVDTVLDVGTGSGVLALAAVALGARSALGFDLDPLAAPAALAAAHANGLGHATGWFTGPIEALAPRAFELVVANLLRRELLPIAAPVAERVATGGRLVLAGLLERDGPAVARAFAPFGLHEEARRMRRDDDGESWLGLVLVREG